jgi:hypothetical protein
LSFREDGTGTGSGFAPREQRRYDFGFTWQSSNDELTITLDGDGFGGVLYTDQIRAQKKVVWSIEEQTSQKMVLSFLDYLDVDGIDGSAWGETHTCRYTFEKVK